MPPLFKYIVIVLAVLPAAEAAGDTSHLAQPASYETPPPAESRSSLQAAIADPQSVPEASAEAHDGLPSAGGFPPLSPPDRSRPDSSAGDRNVPGGLSSLVAVASSLATVVGLFLVFAWVMKRAGPKGSQQLPGDVVEVLGRAPLAGRQQMHLLRCGGKLLLVSVTPDTVETLTEISDPDEVTRLVSLCRQGQSGSTTVAFRQLLDQFGRQPVDSGFAGPASTASTTPSHSSVAGRLGRTDG